jgi:hypothetical protein
MIFYELTTASETPRSLTSFLQSNIQSLFDFKNGRYRDIINLKGPINDFIIEKSDIFEQLDFTVSHNKAFIIILFELCERFGLISTVHIENVINAHDVSIGARLEAARHYLINVRETHDLLNRFDAICDKLEYALLNEEDGESKVVATFINYVVKVINDTNQRIVNQLIDKIKFCQTGNNYKFINLAVISNIVSIDFSDLQDAHSQIQAIFDEYLGHVYLHDRKIINGIINEIFIEADTDYCVLINRPTVKKSFDSIRKLSPRYDRSILSGRGITPLEQEVQLYAYMYWYGPMHNGKLKDSFRYLPVDFFTKDISVIDWACGQAMGSMSYLDYLNTKESSQKISCFTLIEPSELALKRASLHVKKIMEDAEIKTINKDLDSLETKDLSNNNLETKLHLFSNILDIELFSMTKLTKLIFDTYKGENYFVCVSPYITDLKTIRIDSFVSTFSTLNNSFQLIKSINQRNGEWEGTNWSRVVRVFKVVL